MNNPYLIAHLVRGIPAFDIAVILDTEGTPTDPAPWWIIPTSGHRAYPFWHQDLTHGFSIEDILNDWPPPDGHPDHYQAAMDQVHLAEPESEAQGSLLGLLGLGRPQAPLVRRRL